MRRSFSAAVLVLSVGLLLPATGYAQADPDDVSVVVKLEYDSIASYKGGRDDLEPCSIAVSALGRLLEALVERLAEGTLPGEIDERLDAELERAAPPELLQEVAREVERRLEGFAGRLPRATLDETRRRATIDRLRRSLGLPYLG